MRYAISGAFVTMIGIVSYMVVAGLRPTWDPMVVIGSIASLLLVQWWQLLSFMKSEDTRRQSQQTYFQVNHRFDEFKEELEDRTVRLVRESYAIGLKDGGLGVSGVPIVPVIPTPRQIDYDPH